MSDPIDIVERLRGDYESAKRMGLSRPRFSTDEVGCLFAEITRLRDELAMCCELKRAYAERAALAAKVPQWRKPGQVTADHPLECLIVIEALRQSDGDWWHDCGSFVGAYVPIAWMENTDANRAALAAAPGASPPAALAVPAGMALVPKGLLQEARDNAQASCAESGISSMRQEYRAELVTRLDAALAAAQESATTRGRG